jgi:hypothetical protein
MNGGNISQHHTMAERFVRWPMHQPKKIYASFRYRAGSWDHARRVVAKIW